MGVCNVVMFIKVSKYIKILKVNLWDKIKYKIVYCIWFLLKFSSKAF